jgi:hypothetical protein
VLPIESEPPFRVATIRSLPPLYTTLYIQP